MDGAFDDVPTIDSSSLDATETPDVGTDAEVPGVAVAVALGQGARTLVSCDDGRTWVADRFDEVSDDDHSPLSSKGLAWGAGRFVAALGWGAPGHLRASDDAVNWEQVHEETTGFSDVAYGNGRFIAVAGRRVHASEDGLSWSQLSEVGRGANVRRVDFVDVADGRFVVLGDEGRFELSSDGETWVQADLADGSCTDGLGRSGGVASNGDTFVVVGSGGVVCRSDDGATVTNHNVGSGISGSVVWTGTEFQAFNRTDVYRSSDGRTWEMVPSGLERGVIRRSVAMPSGALIGFNRNGDEFYRADSGDDTWTALDASAFMEGNDLTQITVGWVAACP